MKRAEITVYAPGRIARTKVRCLVLGACDGAALDDVRDLVKHWVHGENLTLMRADRPRTVEFADYHSILVFGFYRFWEREALSEALFSYHNSGGGLVIAHGAHRGDAFGVGRPLDSVLPIELGVKPVGEVHRKATFVGSRNMRVVCAARDDGTVLSSWDDGVPFVISKPASRDEGAVIVFNALPVSSGVISGQPHKANRAMARTLGMAIVSVASEVHSRKSSRLALP
jgi:hypothetical protein